MTLISGPDFNKQFFGRKIGQRRNGGFEPVNPNFWPASQVIPPNMADRLAANEALIEQALAASALASENEFRELAADLKLGHGIHVAPAELATWEAAREDGLVRPGFAASLDLKSQVRRNERGAFYPLELARARRNTMEQLLSYNPAYTSTDYNDGVVISERGAIVQTVPQSVAHRAGQYMQELGLQPRAALDLAQLESRMTAELTQQGVHPKRIASLVSNAVGEFLRSPDPGPYGSLWAATEAATEVRPTPYAVSTDPRYMDDDPAVVEVRRPLLGLTDEELKHAQARTGFSKTLGTGRVANAFMPAATHVLPERGGVPLLTAPKIERTGEPNASGRYDKQIPTRFTVKLDPQYADELDISRAALARMPANSPEAQQLAARVAYLEENPVLINRETRLPVISRNALAAHDYGELATRLTELMPGASAPEALRELAAAHDQFVPPFVHLGGGALGTPDELYANAVNEARSRLANLDTANATPAELTAILQGLRVLPSEYTHDPQAKIARTVIADPEHFAVNVVNPSAFSPLEHDDIYYSTPPVPYNPPSPEAFTDTASYKSALAAYNAGYRAKATARRKPYGLLNENLNIRMRVKDGDIQNVREPDPLEEAHGFRLREDPFVERNATRERATVAQRVQQIKDDYKAPLRTYRIPEGGLGAIPQWEGPLPGDTGDGYLRESSGLGVIGPRDKFGDLVRVGNELWTVKPERLQADPAPALVDAPAGSTTRYMYRLGKPVQLMPNGIDIAVDPRTGAREITGRFRLASADPDGQVRHTSIMTNEGWQQFDQLVGLLGRGAGTAPTLARNVADEQFPPPIGLVINQKVPPGRPANRVTYELLEEAGNLPDEGQRIYSGSFPESRVTAVDPRKINPGRSQLFPTFNAIESQAALEGDPALPAMEPANSPTVEHFRRKARTQIVNELNADKQLLASVGDNRSGSRHQKPWPVNRALAPNVDPSLGQVLSSASAARGGLPEGTLKALKPHNRRAYLSTLHNGRPTHHTQLLLEDWRTRGVEDLRPVAQDDSRSNWQPLNAEVVRSAPGDPPVHVSGDEARQAAPGEILGPSQERRPRPTAMQPLEGHSQVKYVPTERGTYVFEPDGVTLRPAASQSVAPSPPSTAQEKSTVVFGDDATKFLSDYVSGVRNRLRSARRGQG